MEFNHIVSSVKKAISKNKVVLVILPQESYRSTSAHLIAKVCSRKVCYLTFNICSKILVQEIEQHGYKSKEFFFMDAVSKQAGLYDGTELHAFFESPRELDEIFSAASLAFEKDFNYFVVDSINSLYLHNSDKKTDVISFIDKFAIRSRTSKAKTLFLAVGIPEERALIDEISVFVDKVVDFSKRRKALI